MVLLPAQEKAPRHRGNLLFGAHLQQTMLHMLKGRLDGVGEGALHQRYRRAEGALQVAQIPDVHAGEDPYLRVVQLRAQPRLPALPEVAHSPIAVELLSCGVGEPIARCGNITGAAGAHQQPPAQRGKAFAPLRPYPQRTHPACRSALQPQLQTPSGLSGKRQGTEAKHPTDGFRTVLHNRCTPEQLDLLHQHGVQLWRVLGSPLLPLDGELIGEHQQAFAYEPAHNRLRDRRSGRERRRPWKPLQQPRDRLPAVLVQLPHPDVHHRLNPLLYWRPLRFNLHRSKLQRLPLEHDHDHRIAHQAKLLHERSKSHRTHAQSVLPSGNIPQLQLPRLVGVPAPVAALQQDTGTDDGFARAIAHHNAHRHRCHTHRSGSAQKQPSHRACPLNGTLQRWRSRERPSGSGFARGLNTLAVNGAEDDTAKQCSEPPHRRAHLRCAPPGGRCAGLCPERLQQPVYAGIPNRAAQAWQRRDAQHASHARAAAAGVVLPQAQSRQFGCASGSASLRWRR
jgi:hypothetical protein